MKLPPVSIIVITLNRAALLDRCLQQILKLDYPRYEVIIVDGGSIDNTQQILTKYKQYKYFKIIYHPRPGIPAGKNIGIINSKYSLVAFVDDDNMVTRGWLKKLVKKLLDLPEKIAATTSVWKWSGHAICYKKKVLYEVGLFDERFTRLRDDTDLAFRMFDKGYDIVHVPEAIFYHQPPLPKTIFEKIKYVIYRTKIHEFDVLLYKKNPERCKFYFNIKFNFLIPPIRDFKIATGLWQGKGHVKLGSRGVDLISNSNPLNFLLVFIGGIAYSLFVKMFRFAGSIKYGKLLL